ncbi:MAG TPA: hypothetical protein VLH79_10820 [Chthonomonadales bacterium]|nr:hypothetical protein [Chthonomonadales bacterium]
MHNLIVSRAVPLSLPWFAHRLECRTPAPGDPSYRPEMGSLTARLPAAREGSR